MESPYSFLTIAEAAQAASRERSSKFLAYAWPVQSEERIREILDATRKKYYDATHVCYAWRLGPAGEAWRVSDDGEPSGTAGRPILGQMLSAGVTDCLVAVVRYFGGTKLGVPGLIAAYKETAGEVLAAAQIVERTVERVFRIEFPYAAMNGVMRVVKEERPQILTQQADNICVLRLSIRAACAERLAERLRKAGAEVTSEL